MNQRLAGDVAGRRECAAPGHQQFRCDVESHETKGREGKAKITGGKKVVSKPVETRYETFR
jgi:hypothetical protein